MMTIGAIDITRISRNAGRGGIFADCICMAVMTVGVGITVMNPANFANRLFNASCFAAKVCVFFNPCVATVTLTRFPMAFFVESPLF